MKKITTVEEFEKELTLEELSAEDFNNIADKYRFTISKEDAANMVCEITEKLKAEAETNPEAKKELDSWDATDKMLFIVREAYTLGAVMATKTTAKAVAKMAADLLTSAEIAIPSKEE